MIPILAAAVAITIGAVPARADGWQLNLPPRPNVVFDETFYPNDGAIHLKSDMTTSCSGAGGDAGCTASGSYGAALGLAGFVGSAVKVHGSASNSNITEPRPVGSFSVYDGQWAVSGDRTVHAGSGVLASHEGLAPKPYWASMNIYWAEQVSVSSVSVTTGMYVNKPDAKFEDAKVETIPAVQATGLNPYYHLNGETWKPASSGNGSHAVGSPGSFVGVLVPQNTTYVKVRGLSGPDAGLLTLSLNTRDGTTKPNLAAANATLESHPTRDSVTASTLFALPLNPQQTYYFEIHSKEANFYLREMSFWSSMTKDGSGGPGDSSVWSAASPSTTTNVALMLGSLLLLSAFI